MFSLICEIYTKIKEGCDCEMGTVWEGEAVRGEEDGESDYDLSVTGT
jgi:hypothetical protein